MVYAPESVANYFLEKASQEERALTPMQLIKLVYIAHGWHLGYFNEALINQQVEAWQYGPVIDSLYHQLKQYGNGPVQAYLSSPVNEEAAIRNSGNTRALLDHVWDRYSRYSGPQLSTLTHQADTPWSKVWNSFGRWSRSAPIPDSLILDHYRGKIAANG